MQNEQEWWWYDSSHIVSKCGKFAECKKNARVATAIHCCTAKKLGFSASNQWYQKWAEPTVKNKQAQQFWNINGYTYHVVSVKSTDIVLGKKETWNVWWVTLMRSENGLERRRDDREVWWPVQRAKKDVGEGEGEGRWREVKSGLNLSSSNCFWPSCQQPLRENAEESLGDKESVMCA